MVSFQSPTIISEKKKSYLTRLVFSQRFLNWQKKALRHQFFLYRHVYALVVTLSDIYKKCNIFIGIFVVSIALTLDFLASGGVLTVIFVR